MGHSAACRYSIRLGCIHHVYDVSQSSFDPGVKNQGWWSEETDATDDNANYVVMGPDGNAFRNFFTFDLSRLSGTVDTATLRLTRFGFSGGAVKTIEFFDVSTPADEVNANVGLNSAIFADLGSGTSYGSFDITGPDNYDDVLEFQLNPAALTDIMSAHGYFTIGGTLISNDGGGSVFAGSNSGGVQELVLTGNLDEPGDANGDARLTELTT
ncbi:MAG: hypothetical protein R3C10_25635 [Pirellulales bacterium]